jgi:hypothetical protein
MRANVKEAKMPKQVMLLRRVFSVTSLFGYFFGNEKSNNHLQEVNLLPLKIPFITIPLNRDSNHIAGENHINPALSYNG